MSDISIICRNGSTHTHKSVFESKVCYGLIVYPSAPASVPAPVTDMVTTKQLDYIAVLHGDTVHAAKLTRRSASDYIKHLIKNKKDAPVTVPVSAYVPPVEVEIAPTEEVPTTSKTDMVKGLIKMVPDGYFAVRAYDGAPISFLKVARPKNGNFRDGVKISSQHGPSLEVRWVLWPSQRVSVYRWNGHDIEEDMLLLIADWKGCTRLYAEKMKKCGRCNTKLTDPRSRFYGIGPECEKHWAWWLDDVAEERGGYWEQQPVSVQEKFFPSYEEA